jgi:hypothetical protein
LFLSIYLGRLRELPAELAAAIGHRVLGAVFAILSDRLPGYCYGKLAFSLRQLPG